MQRSQSASTWLSRLGLVACAVVGAGCFGSTQEDVKLAKAEYGLANDAFTRGSYREALDHIEKAVEADTENADAAYLGALTHLVFCAQDEDSPDCRLAEAERYARLAIQADENMRDAVNALGVILVHQGRPLEAIEVLEPLSKDMLYLSPEKAWGNLGWAATERCSAGTASSRLPASRYAQPRLPHAFSGDR